jgi:UDP-N-acetyl-2-amino-2-deoxyglucuronate dehydrogenase
MTTKQRVGIGIVGCGMISAVQAEAIARLPDARIVAFCDRALSKAEARANQFGGHAFNRLDEFLKHPNLDAVSVCTPSGLHMEVALQAANAGKHVMVEKPLEVSLERADAIVAGCRVNRVKLGAIFPRRLLKSVQVLKSAIDAGRFGTIVLADVYIKWFRSREYYASGGWRGTYRFDGGGALMNQGIHGIDLLQWLMGGVSQVTAFAATRAHPQIEVEDVAVAALTFHSGALGVVEGTTGAWPGQTIRLEISGTEGRVVLEDEALSAWQFRYERPEDDTIRERFTARSATSGGATDPKAISTEGHELQFADFVQAIRDDRAPVIPGSEARDAVAIITSIYRSAREGRVVRLDHS